MLRESLQPWDPRAFSPAAGCFMAGVILRRPYPAANRRLTRECVPSDKFGAFVYRDRLSSRMRRERRAETSLHFTEGKRCCAFTELLNFRCHGICRGLLTHPDDWHPWMSGLCVSWYELPGSLLNAGDLTLVSQLAEADTADTVLTHVCVRTTTDLASGVFSGGELLRLLLL